MPPELCYLEGMPDHVRNNGNLKTQMMRSCQKTPNEKYESLEKFTKMFTVKKAFQEWGIVIESDHLTLKAKILPQPLISIDRGLAPADENMLRNLPVSNPSD